jgi:hypothetical protein
MIFNFNGKITKNQLLTMEEKQLRAYNFLKDKFKSQSLFSKEEFNEYVGWGKKINTYWSKKIKTLVIKENNNYRVSQVFRRVLTEENFERHISQSSRVSTEFKTFSSKNVILFDFFLPLSNELYLRDSLDALFYKDSILKRLKIVNFEKLIAQVKKNNNENEESYFNRICDWISGKFGGYSISHVNGRFRADDLMNLNDVYENLVSEGYKYLIDETTAIVRFIIPCGNPTERLFLSSKDYYDDILFDDDTEENEIKKEADQIRWFFYVLFVQSIIEMINGEDEIWMLESGYKSRLHIWRMEK